MAESAQSEELQALGRVLDRLAATDDRRLPQVLDKLLPRLVQMTDQQHLRDTLSQIFSHLLKRVRPNQDIQLPVLDLLHLIQPQASPFVINFSIIFADVGIARASLEDKAAIAALALSRSCEFPQFSSASNALLNYVLSTLQAMPAGAAEPMQSIAQTVLADWLMDVLLLQSPIEKDAPGSVQPGLSVARANRLTEKIKKWTAAELLSTKQQILHLLSVRALGHVWSIVLCVIASVDTSQTIAQRDAGILQALESSKLVQDDPDIPRILLALFAGSTTDNSITAASGNQGAIPSQAADASAIVGAKRSALRDSVKAAIIHWLNRRRPDTAVLFPQECLKAFATGLAENRTSTKLQSTSAALGAHLAAHCSAEQLPLIGALMLAILRRVVAQFSNMVATSANDDSLALKESCYMIIATVAQRAPEVAARDLELVAVLFDLAESEDQRIRVRLASALGEMRKAVAATMSFSDSTQHDRRRNLAVLVQRASRSQDYRVRLSALEWMTVLESPTSQQYLQMLLTLCNDSHDAVASFAHKCVDELIATLREPTVAAADATDEAATPTGGEAKRIRLDEAAAGTGPSTSGVFQAFCSDVAEVFAQLLQANSSHLDTILPSGVAAVRIVHAAFARFAAELHNLGDDLHRDPLQPWQPWCATSRAGDDELPGFSHDQAASYTAMLTQLLELSREWLPLDPRKATLVLEALAAAAKVVTYSPLSVTQSLRSARLYVPWLAAREVGVRKVAAELLGLSVVQQSSNELATLFRQLRLKADYRQAFQTATSPDARAQFEAAADAITRVLVVLMLRSNTGVQTDQAAELARQFGEWVRTLLELLTSESATEVPRMVLHHLGTLGSYELSQELRDIVSQTIPALIELMSNSSSDPAVRAAATVSVGKMLNGQYDVALAEQVTDVVLSWRSSSDPVMKFAAGECLSCVFAQAQQQGHTVLAERVLSVITAEDLKQELESLTTQAAWALVFVRRFWGSPRLSDTVVPNLVDVLLHALSSPSLFGQDVACRALALAHELSATPQTRELIVKSILNTFTREKTPIQPAGYAYGVVDDRASRRAAQRAGFDEEGVIHQVCKLAKDAQQPELVFYLMMIVYQDPSWSTGDARQFEERYRPSKVRATAVRNLDLVVPKLYKYKHDPNPDVRAILESLWATVVRHSNTAVTRFFDPIIRELLAALESRKWRERESACNALAALLVGRTHPQVGEYVERLWSLGFRVVDDLRETVREAAIAYMRTLVSLTVRLCDITQSEPPVVAAMVDTMIPFLLHKGLLDYSAEGKGISIGALVQIVKSAGDHVKPHLPAVVDTLIEAMSALEPRTLQYMQFHTASMQMTDDQLEALRVRMIQQSPLHEALQSALAFVDRSNIADVVHHTTKHLRTGVGLPTRAAAASTVVHLCEQFPNEMRRFAEGVFMSLLRQLTGTALHSQTLFDASLSALGSLSKLLEGSELRTVLCGICEKYRTMPSDDPKLAETLGATASRIVSRSGDAIPPKDPAWEPILMTAFVGSFDNDARVKSHWSLVLEEGCTAAGYGNKTAAVQQYVEFAISLCMQLLQQLSWPRRRQGIHALDEVFAAVEKQQARVHDSVLSSMAVLLQALPGRIWEGKEQILLTLGTAAKLCSDALDPSAPCEVVIFDAVDGTARVRLTDVTTSGQQAAAGDSSLPKLESKEETSPRGDVAAEELAQETPVEMTEAAQLSEAVQFWSSCKVSLAGLLAVYLHQLRRGDRDYKRSAVSGLQRLPVEAMAEAGNPFVLEALQRLLHIAGLLTGETEQTEGRSTDPVLRSRLVEFAARLYHVQVQQLSEPLVEAILASLASDVWSVRVSSLKLLTAIAIHAQPDTPIVQLENILNGVALAVDDGRYPQVRAAGIAVLTALWSNALVSERLTQELQAQERGIVELLAAEQDSRVLQELGKLKSSRRS